MKDECYEVMVDGSIQADTLNMPIRYDSLTDALNDAATMVDGGYDVVVHKLTVEVVYASYADAR